jgi:3-methyl-2-oxobutanoate hydroxymethyltransferase
MGHLGLTPQSVHKLGGYSVQGREEEKRKRLIEDALILQDAGIFSLVLEKVPASLAQKYLRSLQYLQLELELEMAVMVRSLL